MKLCTYLMNSTKKEYIIIGNDYPSKTGDFLEKLEKYSNWNLRHDNIHVSYTYSNFGFRDVKDIIYGKDNNVGGEIINEYIELYKLDSRH